MLPAQCYECWACLHRVLEGARLGLVFSFSDENLLPICPKHQVRGRLECGLDVFWPGRRYALGAWDMFKACAHRELILMKRHSFTYKTRCACRICASKPLLGLVAKCFSKESGMVQSRQEACVSMHPWS